MSAPLRPDDSNPATVPPGWNLHWSQQWEQLDDPDLLPCRVVRIDKGGITVATRPGDDRLVIAAKAVRRVVVGDVCGLDADAGRIEAILPRVTVFERRAPGVARDQLQLSARAVAANMDLVFVLQPLTPGVNPARLARELVLAWESGARPVVVLTKADLVSAGTISEQRRLAERFAPGVEVHAISSTVPADQHTSSLSSEQTDGLAGLRAVLGSGPHVVALLGASGAGKSTLVNALAGRRVQLVAEVREGDGRGRHTTTAGQMVQLADGSLLIDTPGIRGVGLWESDAGFELAFSDLATFVQQCRFADCTHTTEPGCGLLAAVEQGLVGEDRVEVWRSLTGELDELDADLEERSWAERSERNQRARRRSAKRDQRRIDDE